MRIVKKRNTKKDTRLIDNFMIAGGIIGPLSAIPQIVTIYVNKSAGQVSLFSWVLFMLLSIVGIVYSLVHKERIILIGYTLYFLVDASVVIGILSYS